MIETNLEIRQAVMKLKASKVMTINVAGIPTEEIAAQAIRFGRLKRIGVLAKPGSDGVTLTLTEFTPNPNLYPELDLLTPGRSHLYELLPAAHQRIRLAASNRSRQGRGLFSCSREGDYMRVTRLPATDAERAACGPVQVLARATVYDLDRLSAARKLSFDIPRDEHDKLRLAAHRKAVKTGWTIRCRIQDDGTMLVYRTDAGAPQATSDSGTTGSIEA